MNFKRFLYQARIVSLGKAMKELFISEIHVDYSGSGDSGCIDDTRFYRDKTDITDEITDVDTNINMVYSEDFVSSVKSWTTFWQTKDFSQIIELDNKTIPRAKELITETIEEICYWQLEDRHEGWEIDEGADGSFLIAFKPEINTVEISFDHNQYYRDSQNYHYDNGYSITKEMGELADAI